MKTSLVAAPEVTFRGIDQIVEGEYFLVADFTTLPEPLRDRVTKIVTATKKLPVFKMYGNRSISLKANVNFIFTESVAYEDLADCEVVVLAM